MRVGVVGLGTIGSGVARCVRAGGFEVTAFDPDHDRLAGSAGTADRASSNRDLAERVDLVVVAVFDDEQVREALSGQDGVFTATDPPNTVFILSTVSMDTIAWAGAEGSRRGIEVLDCGVAGGRGLDTGGLVSMVGGERQAFERARPVLETFSNPLLYMGALGSGMKAKLGRNMLHYGLSLLAFEAGSLMREAGIDGAQFVAAVRAREDIGPGFFDFLSVASGAVEANGLSLEAQARYAVKDLAAAIELGHDLGVQLTTAAHARAQFAANTGG